MKVLTLALAAALCAPAVAQKMGSSNSNAPTINQSIEMGDVEMSLNYIAITWAEGKTMKAAMDKENGGRYREFINRNAKDNPLCEFSTSVDTMLGNMKIPAGDYKVGFTIDDNCDWHINFMGDETMKMKLPLVPNKDMQHKRLVFSLYCSDDGGCAAYLAFGAQMAMLEFTPAKQ